MFISCFRNPISTCVTENWRKHNSGKQPMVDSIVEPIQSSGIKDQTLNTNNGKCTWWTSSSWTQEISTWRGINIQVTMNTYVISCLHCYKSLTNMITSSEQFKWYKNKYCYRYRGKTRKRTTVVVVLLSHTSLQQLGHCWCCHIGRHRNSGCSVALPYLIPSAWTLLVLPYWTANAIENFTYTAS